MKLNVKLALYVTVAACLCTAVVSALSFAEMRRSIARDIRTDIVALVDTVYNTAAAAAYVENDELSLEVIGGLERNNVVRCATITVTASNREIASQPGCSGDVTVERALVSPFDVSEIMGVLRIIENDAAVRKLAQERALREASVFAIIITLTVLMVFFITFISVTKPLQLFARRLEGIDLSEHENRSFEESQRDDEIGVIGRVVNLLLANASQQIKREKLLALQTELLSANFKMTFELSKTALAVVDHGLCISSINPAFKRIFTADLDLNSEHFKKTWMQYLFLDDEEVAEKLLSAEALNQPKTVEVNLSGSEYIAKNHRSFALTFVKTKDPISQTNYLIFLDDITEHKRKLEATQKAASYDPLTQLLNRGAGKRELTQALANLESGDQMAILVLDLDGFKNINDRYGHDAGDHLLRTIASRINAVTRSSDILSRWGGDEFVLGLQDIEESQARAIGEKIVNVIGKPVPYKNHSLRVGVSVGISLTDHRAASLDCLVDIADTAMYEVKRRGKNGVELTISPAAV